MNNVEKFPPLKDVVACSGCPYYKGETFGEGICIRHPPVSYPIGGRQGEVTGVTMWPRVQAAMVCGEHPAFRFP